MADKSISDLIQALQITGEDLFVLEQNGEAKKLKLLRRFKSIYGIARATADEIAEVAGVNATVAAEVRRVASSAASERT